MADTDQFTMLSVFDIFKIGIGPSSSHTVGPMRAAGLFVWALQEKSLIDRVARIRVELYGSLGATGHGHATDTGILLGLMGERPETVDPAAVKDSLEAVSSKNCLSLLGRHPIALNPAHDILFLGEQVRPEHPNVLNLCAFDSNGTLLQEELYLSVGGGFVSRAGKSPSSEPAPPLCPYQFKSGSDLVALTEQHGKSVAQLMFDNERTWRSSEEVRDGLLHIWQVMQECGQRGLGIAENPDTMQQYLPGGLQVRRRAPALYRRLSERATQTQESLQTMDWVNAFAMAVNEENARGGRVVTAPTNGAAGVVPAVLHYYTRFISGAAEQGVIDFLLTAAAIGILYKTNASISGAEVGCQGEVGVACSMAAAGLAAVMGGTPRQVENAAEIGMEHNLGLTCDPVGGMVQIPCVERNAMGAVKAVNAARIALMGDGTHHVSLDNVIKTMKQTGEDMKNIYKETSMGGLAVNVVEC